MTMTYDQWKTTDPRDREPDAEDEQTELEFAFEQLREARLDLEIAKQTAAKRIEELTASLEEAYEYIKEHYDVVDGDYGEQAPNKAMRIGTMIDETLHGIRF
jgi:hypothetical protein